jgi:hypothetical protein
MNKPLSYTLVARPENGRTLHAWAVAARGVFSVAVFLTDIAFIVAMSCLTGVAYHLAIYGEPGNVGSFIQLGVLAASIFAVSNAFRGEYRLPSFFTFKPHGRRTVQLWNVTLISLLALGFLSHISDDYSRGYIVLFYGATLAGLIVLRFAVVRVAALARGAGLLSAQRIFLIGTGAQIGGFLHRYEPWMLGINIVGCRFLTPARLPLDRDLPEAVASVRGLEPDAIYLMVPWSATETIERCAETFLALPVEIHLGPEQILHKFEEVELSRLGPLASLQITRVALSRLEIVQKRLFDLFFAAIGLIAATPGTGVVRAAPLRLQSTAVPHHQIPHHAHARRRRRDRAGAAGRSAADQGRPLAAALEPRRDPAALQRPHRRHVARRPAPARALPRPGFRPPHRALRPPPQRQARHHRLGPDPRLARRNRHRREDAQARRV